MRILLLVTAGVMVLAMAAMATPIPGANNEIVNGEFEQGLLNWEYTQGQVAISTFGHSGNSVQCAMNTSDWGDRIRQVVDDSKGNLWDPNLHAKVIDLEAWISVDVKSDQIGGVRFRLDWWDESYNSWDEVPSATATGYHVTDWKAYTTREGYGTNFTYVNPFAQVALVSDAGLPVQPRWVSVEIEFLQPENVINRVDSIVLTSKCVPEPSALAALLAGLGSIGALRVFKRK